METSRLTLTYAVDTAPAGPDIGAFFDLDGTLMAGFSVMAFARDRLASGQLTLHDLADIAVSGISFRRGGLGFSGLMAALTRMLRGSSEAEMLETGRRLCEEQLAVLLYDEARELVEAHRARGHTLAIVSAATRYQAEPIAAELGIANVLCTELEVKGGRLTGRVRPPPCWGTGKLAAARRLSAELGFELGKSYFYTDSYEDMPLLERVGMPRPTNPDPDLEALARRRAWPVLRFRKPNAATRGDRVRSLLALSLLPGAALASTGAALLSGRIRGPLNLCVSASSDALTRLAGLELRVEGRDFLHSQRPAVFLFNRQSALDALLVGRILRHDFAPLLPRELSESRLLGLVARFGESALVAEPDSSLDFSRAVATLEGGVSIVAAAGAHRAPHRRLQPFRKLPFQIAARAGVPIVPIVIHNSAAALPRGSPVVRAGPIDITVLPPIPTRTWRPGSVQRQLTALHDRYAALLGESSG